MAVNFKCVLLQLQLALTYASRSGNSAIADRINDILCRRESLPPLSDDEDLSCDEDHEVTEQSSLVTSLQPKQPRISSNSFRLLKKLPSSYGRSSSVKETVGAKHDAYQWQNDNDDVLSDSDSRGIGNDIPSGSHDQEATSINENNTLQLFDDSDDVNSDEQEKTKEPAAISKHTKPSLGITCRRCNQIIFI